MVNCNTFWDEKAFNPQKEFKNDLGIFKTYFNTYFAIFRRILFRQTDFKNSKSYLD